MSDYYSIIVAHPDDEVLWCSSLVAGARQVIICFSDTTTSREVSEGRRRLASGRIPKNYIFLGLNEATYIGVNSSGKILVEEKEIREREDELEGTIRDVIVSRALYTHNPWGEYGHPEHRQVHRVVSKICKEDGLELNVFGYYSRNTFKERRLYAGLLREGESTKERTDIKLYQKMKRLYQDLGCWTWTDSYLPARYEIFHGLDNTRKEADTTRRVPGVYVTRLAIRPAKRGSAEGCIVTKGGIEGHCLFYLDSMLQQSLSLIRCCMDVSRKIRGVASRHDLGDNSGAS